MSKGKVFKMSDFISGCIVGALVASVIVVIVMCLLLASKEADYTPPAPQSDIEKIESLEMFVREPVNSKNVEVGWEAKYGGYLYGDYISSKNLNADYELFDVINLLLRQGLESLKEIAKIEREGRTKEYLELIASIRQKESCGIKNE